MTHPVCYSDFLFVRGHQSEESWLKGEGGEGGLFLSVDELSSYTKTQKNCD